MAEVENQPAGETPQSSPPSGGAKMNPYLAGVLGWLVPGLGHLMLKKYDRAAVFFVSIVTMALLGLAMGAKLYLPEWSFDEGFFVGILHKLSFLGDMGVGTLFMGGWMAGFGREYLPRASGDYGTVFFLCSGLLNLLTVLDAYDIAAGKKE